MYGKLRQSFNQISKVMDQYLQHTRVEVWAQSWQLLEY